MIKRDSILRFSLPITPKVFKRVRGYNHTKFAKVCRMSCLSHGGHLGIAVSSFT